MVGEARPGKVEATSRVEALCFRWNLALTLVGAKAPWQPERLPLCQGLGFRGARRSSRRGSRRDGKLPGVEVGANLGSL